MKYFNGKELLMFLETPVTFLSIFETETIDFSLYMCDQLFPQLMDFFKISLDFPTFKYQVIKSMGEYLSLCREKKHIGLRNPRKRMDEDYYKAMQVDLTKWPKHMQKKNAENYFLIQYVLAFDNIVYRYLMDRGLPQDEAHRISDQLGLNLADWIEENCVDRCEYKCIRRNASKGYCNLCKDMIQALPCPKKQEISYQSLQMEESDFNCLRK